jgi:hypothetical protein
MIDNKCSLSSSSPVSERLRTDGGNGNRNQKKSNTGQERHRALRELRSELARHPAVLTVAGKPAGSGEYRELRAVLNPAAFERTADDASLRVTWISDLSPGPEVSDRSSDRWLRTPIRAYYTLHYSESSGFDCGFHCEPNPHVDGLLHYQERSNPNEKYTYEPVSFEARSLSALLWELMDALTDRLADSG